MSMSIQNSRPVGAANIEASQAVKDSILGVKITQNEITSLHVARETSVILIEKRNALYERFAKLSSERMDLSHEYMSDSNWPSQKNSDVYNKKIQEYSKNMDELSLDLNIVGLQIAKNDGIILENEEKIRRGFVEDLRRMSGDEKIKNA